MATFPSPAEIQRQIDALLKVATAPQTLEALEKVDAAPANQRSQLTEELVTPKVLAAKGVSMPEGMRISLRTFEQQTDETLGWYTYDSATGEQGMVKPGIAMPDVKGGPD